MMYALSRRLRRNRWLWLLLVFVLLSACGGDDDDDSTDDDAAPADDDDDDDDDDNDDDDDDDPAVAAAVALADTWLDTYEPETMGWSWDSGVLMLGLWELANLTDDSTYRDYVRDWLDHHIAVGYTIAYNDHVPPARLALRLYQETGEVAYRDAVDAAKAYLFQQAERLPDGALVHMGWTSPRQIWVDSVYMVAPFLVEAGLLDADEACIADAMTQFRVFAEHLQDPATGLYRHRYDARDDAVTPVQPDFWGRGNAWVVAASGTALLRLPNTTEGWTGILSRHDEQTAAMAQRLADANRWHTIMNRPATYLETSVGPLFAYGVYQTASATSVSDAILAAADRALAGALDQIVIDDGGDTLLLGTSYGTAPSTWEMYQEVLKGEQVNYGVGAVLLAVTARAAAGRTEPLPAPRATDETYIAPPVDDDDVAWGYFYLARGDFRSGLTSFDAALAVDDSDAGANIGVGLVETIRFAMGVLAGIDAWYVEEISLLDLVGQLLGDGRATGESLAGRMMIVADDTGFSRLIQRLVLTEQGGSTAVGAVEVDLGEAYLLQAVAHLLVGAADVADGLGLAAALDVVHAASPWRAFLHQLRHGQKLDPASIGRGLDSLIATCDSLTAMIESIDAETDDQSDDLLPKNLIYLEGDFGVPGVLLPTPLDELLGFDPRELFGDDPLPQALLDLIDDVRGALSLVRSFLP